MNDQEGAGAQPARDEQQQQSRPQERGGGSASHHRERGDRRRHAQQNQQPRRSEAQLPMDELRDLFALFTEHGLTEFELERDNFRVHLGRSLAASVEAVMQPQITAAPHVVPMPATAAPPSPSASVAQHATAATPAAAQPATTATPAEQAAPEEESVHIITSPIVGTFYRSPSPTAEPFVRLGSRVQPDSVVCIIEAMKLMNEIQAETSGEITKIYVENGQPVEYGQPLFGVKK